MNFGPQYLELLTVAFFFGSVAMLTLSINVYVKTLRRETKSRADQYNFQQWREKQVHEIEMRDRRSRAWEDKARRDYSEMKYAHDEFENVVARSGIKRAN